jgi:CubicO group peptidase (beta-lactamase class C family)
VRALAAVADWPVGHASVAVVAVHPESDGGPGGRPDASPGLLGSVGSPERPYPWASVTKPATALAVLVAHEEGSLDVDEPAGPPGSTVRHLLCHASGLGPEPGSPMAAPGANRIYSNAGYLVLARLLEERTGMDFAAYLRAGVLEPLGMDRTTLGADALAAAAGLAGPLGDLVALGRELAAPTLISDETHRSAVSSQFPGLGGVLPGFGWFQPCPWGLGVEIRGDKQPHWTGTTNSPETFGHFGRSGSFLWVDPVAGLLCAGLADRQFGPWAARAWPRLADAVLREAAPVPPMGPPPVDDPGRPADPH